jgi:hypothetical protein
MRILRLVYCFSFALLMLTMTTSLFAGVSVSVTIAPPVLPLYEQPPCPGDGYIWTPGYWAHGPAGYYWVPGTWVTPPTVGLLWTPGYWGWNGGGYVWNAGYWGPHVGFYGGVNYGFGYVGTGYEGGYWRGRDFFYNRNVNNVRITNVHIYNKTVINNVTVNRVSYNGGRGGINARPTREQESATRERHFEPTGMQMRHEHGAGSNRAFLASENHGRPAIAATPRPGEFHGREGIAAHSGQAPERRAENRSVPRQQNSARDMERPTARQETHGNRVVQPEHGTFRPETGGGSPRPSAYHPEGTRPQANAPRQERESHSAGGRDKKPR